MDNEVAEKFMKILEKQGLNFKLGHAVESTKIVEDKVILSIRDVAKENIEEIEADVVLVAVGRKPNTNGLGLKDLKLDIDEQGFIKTNSNFQTSINNIYAIGDVIKGPMLAHKAEEDGVAAVEIINGEAGHVDYNLVPGIIYTAPEVAVIGKTEEELKEEGIVFNKGVFPLSANSRAKAINHTDGMVKILSDKSTDITLDLVRHDGENPHKFESDIVKHHEKNYRELNNISPNLCRQRSYEAYEDFTYIDSTKETEG